MGLLNYTTKIDADKTASEIARCLSLHGASAILTEYNKEEQYIEKISFRIQMGEQNLSFKLPVDWKPVYEIMAKGKKFTWGDRGEKQKAELRLQAVRTAWRIVKDWVEAQMALVETNMVQLGEVFLPYATMKDGRTLGQTIATDPKFLLGDGKQKMYDEFNDFIDIKMGEQIIKNI